MKANWKLALMCAAAITFAFTSCKKKDEPKPQDQEQKDTDKDQDPGEEEGSVISVTDGTAAEWANLAAATATCPEDGLYLGLKSVKVYADELYINVLVEYDPEELPDRAWVPFHMYINVDNSDQTGGYGDQFLDANSDILLEGAVFAEDATCAYAPEVFAWIGEVGGTGWSWSDPLTAAGEFCATQHVAGNLIEIQMLREIIPLPAGLAWADEFGIGFDIQQNWESVGILPLNSPDAEGSDASGHAKKIQVKINK